MGGIRTRKEKAPFHGAREIRAAEESIGSKTQ